jgi:putative hydrolase of the HAD superfamily
MSELRAVVFGLHLTLMSDVGSGTREKALELVANAGLGNDERLAAWRGTQERSYRGELRTMLSRVRTALAEAGHDDTEGTLANELTGLLIAREVRMLYPDVHTSLEELRRRSYGLAVLSNIPPDEVHWIGQYELDVYFDALVLSCEVGLVKPEPAIYRCAAERLGVRPEECAFADDVPSYVAGAQEVGMAGVRITRPGAYPTREAMRGEWSIPDLTVRGLGELVEWLPTRSRD